MLYLTGIDQLHHSGPPRAKVLLIWHAGKIYPVTGVKVQFTWYRA